MSAHPLLAPLLRGERRALAQAITLVESTREADRVQAQALLAQARPHAGAALRMAISGVPGVGKSTFIEALGLAAIASGRRVAVLAIDPSSSRSGGSILGDKTRMQRLAAHEAAFVRPSPSSGMLGGVAARTRESLLLCEAAGYDLLLVETVGVGQSETAATSLVDLMLLLQLPHGGDELQAIKRGIMEVADIVVVNKADVDVSAARRAAAQLGAGRGRRGPAHVVSALTGDGIEDLWQVIEDMAAARQESGERERRRHLQEASMPVDDSVCAQADVAATGRPFRILGLQQVAVGAADKGRLHHLWVQLFGLDVVGRYTSEPENVDEDICTLGAGVHAVEVDLMQPLDASRKPAVHVPPLNHIGLWVDDLAQAVQWLSAQGVRFAPGGIRKGGSGHDVCFIHPRGNDEFPFGGEGVLIELVQAPPEVIAALAPR